MHNIDTATSQVAAALHDSWRESRRLPDGSYEPRWKDDNTVDIANTDFANLPPKWQAENLAAAQHAVATVLRTNDTESAAAAVHVAWLERNGQWAPEQQKLPYDQLDDIEREKDRVVVRLAATATGITLI